MQESQLSSVHTQSFFKVKNYFQKAKNSKDEINDEEESKDISEQSQLNKYWQSCNNDSRFITICLLVSNFVF